MSKQHTGSTMLGYSLCNDAACWCGGVPENKVPLVGYQQYTKAEVEAAFDAGSLAGITSVAKGFKALEAAMSGQGVRITWAVVHAAVAGYKQAIEEAQVEAKEGRDGTGKS